MSRKAKWKEFPEDELKKIVDESKSFREVATKLGYSKDGGGTISSIHNMCEELSLDTSHFLGQAWNKENYDYRLFSKGSVKKNGETTLKPLIKIRGRKCENCGLSEWMGNPINLEIHHIDGNRTNNCLENLAILCPNCHSFTENWRGRGKRKRTAKEHLMEKSLE